MISVESLLTLDASRFINGEIPTPATDGAQTVFTVANAYESGTLSVFRDQSALQQGSGKDFEETTDTTFTVVSAPDADEELWVCYIKQ